MIVSLDVAYCSQLYFLPLRLPEGELFGVELITHFSTLDEAVRIPTELIVPYITLEQELTLFQEKLSLLETQRDFFIAQHLVAWVNINEDIVDAILSTPELISRLQQLAFIRLTVRESFQDLNLGRDNLQLREISQHLPLTLGDFGAGIATTKSIFDGLFSAVMLDNTFIHKQIHSPSFVPFMKAILGQISPCCSELLIGGIDDEESLAKAQLLGFSAMKGNLWPAVRAESLSSLL